MLIYNNDRLISLSVKTEYYQKKKKKTEYYQDTFNSLLNCSVLIKRIFPNDLVFVKDIFTH